MEFADCLSRVMMLLDSVRLEVYFTQPLDSSIDTWAFAETNPWQYGYIKRRAGTCNLWQD